MSTDNIIQHLLDGNISSAKMETENIIYNKIQNELEAATQLVTSEVYGESIGIAGMIKKKMLELGLDNKDSEDSEELDPVGQEDSDVNNDGKEDGSDEYLKNRRKTVGNAIKKKKNGDDDVNEAQYTSDKAKGTGTTSEYINLKPINQLKKKKKT
tara:strand:- start:505 stop:969 length:465 start_codon:yes stop_codon:yes gene_type:complete